MKKAIFGSALAIAAAFGLQSFNYSMMAGPYLFKVNVGINKAKGMSATLFPNQVTYVNSIADAGCPATTGYDCVVTFATSALTSGHEHLSGTNQVAVRKTLDTRGLM